MAQFVTVILAGRTSRSSQLGRFRGQAILSDQQGNYVWVIGEGNKAEQRRVTAGAEHAGDRR